MDRGGRRGWYGTIFKILGGLEKRTVLLCGLQGVFTASSRKLEFSASIHPSQVRPIQPLLLSFRTESFSCHSLLQLLLGETCNHLTEMLCYFIMVGSLSSLDEADAVWREGYRFRPVRRVAKPGEDCACDFIVGLEGYLHDYRMLFQ